MNSTRDTRPRILLAMFQLSLCVAGVNVEAGLVGTCKITEFEWKRILPES